MGACPKCGQFRVVGPFYVSARGVHPERLRYVCAQCGYEMFTPTEDRKRDERRFEEALERYDEDAHPESRKP